MSDKPKPLKEIDMRQVTGGISRNIQQPANAARFLNQLITDLNAALSRISELESRVDELQGNKSEQQSSEKPLKGSSKKADSLNI